ncbi:MAG: hypothetical protein PHO67_08310 [Candidatus Omnitrophica bacterium]|nr:hypothetical protein [Candidatus Omnitrophota bacterium]
MARKTREGIAALSPRDQQKKDALGWDEETFRRIIKQPPGDRLFIGELLAGKFPLFRATNSGMIFYPNFPEKLHGTKEANRPDFDLTPFYDWPQWLQNCDSEGGACEVTKDGYVIWWGGTIHDGIWCGDDKTLWMGGLFRDGIIIDGQFWNCTVLNGEKRGGDIHSGIWHGGVHRGGKFEGLWLGGTWMGGEFNGFKERTTEAPPLVTTYNWARR